MGLVQNYLPGSKNHGKFNESVAVSFAVQDFQMKIPGQLQLYTDSFHKFRLQSGRIA